jgi:hypothetical protein
MKVKLQNVRLSFPGLFKAEAFKPGDAPKYKATFLVEKGSKLNAVIDAAILETAKGKWGAKAAQIVQGMRGNPNKFCYQDGDTKAYNGFAGMMALAAKSSVRPLVLDKDKTPLTEQDGKPYAGCYVNATIELFAYENSGNGISAQVLGVQFVADGDSFGGGAIGSPDDFDDLAVGSDEDALV